jgi:hypothetical protein
VLPPTHNPPSWLLALMIARRPASILWYEVRTEFRGDMARTLRPMIPKDMMCTDTRIIGVSITMFLYSATAYIIHIAEAISRTALNTQSFCVDVTLLTSTTKCWQADLNTFPAFQNHTGRLYQFESHSVFNNPARLT